MYSIVSLYRELRRLGVGFSIEWQYIHESELTVKPLCMQQVQPMVQAANIRHPALRRNSGKANLGDVGALRIRVEFWGPL